MMGGEAIVAQSNTKMPTLIVGGLHAHSPRDPVREATRLAASVPDETRCVILFGFGFGYLAEALVARFAPHAVPGTEQTISIIALEADPDILELARGTRDLADLFSNPCFSILVPGDEAALPDLVGNLNHPPCILKNAALVKHKSRWYGEQEKLIELLGRRARTNKATKAKFARRWIRNTVKNADLAWQLPGIRELKEVFEGLPALLVAAGPSLDKYRHLLPALRERCLVVCVDTALRACLDAGCTPDFVLAVDPQYWNARHLDHVNTAECTLVSELALWPALWRLPWKTCYLYSSQFPLGSWLESRVDTKGPLAAGGSVATSAWDFCRYLGCRDIHVLGLDLAYPAGRTHMLGAVFEEYSLMRATRLHPTELDSFMVPHGSFASRVPARNGGMVLCDARMKMYVSWFSHVCSGDTAFRIHSVGTAGAAIDGIDAIEAEALLALPPIRMELEARKRDRDNGSKRKWTLTAAAREGAFNAAIATLMKQLRLLQNASAEAALACERALARELPLGESQDCTDKETARIVGEAFIAHDRAEALTGQENVKEVVGFLFSSCEAVDQSLAESPSNKLRYHLAWVWALWRELEASARWQHDLLRKKFKVPSGGVDT